MKEYVSELERIYLEEVIPRLDDQIKSMNLGRRANCCLVNAKIFNIKELVQAIKSGIHIDMLSKESREEIINNLKEMGKL